MTDTILLIDLYKIIEDVQLNDIHNNKFCEAEISTLLALLIL